MCVCVCVCVRARARVCVISTTHIYIQSRDGDSVCEGQTWSLRLLAAMAAFTGIRRIMTANPAKMEKPIVK